MKSIHTLMLTFLGALSAAAQIPVNSAPESSRPPHLTVS